MPPSDPIGSQALAPAGPEPKSVIGAFNELLTQPLAMVRRSGGSAGGRPAGRPFAGAPPFLRLLGIPPRPLPRGRAGLAPAPAGAPATAPPPSLLAPLPVSFRRRAGGRA